MKVFRSNPEFRILRLTFHRKSASKCWIKEIITIHHECPCRIEISHPRGQNFNQGLGKPRPWLKFRPRALDIYILHGQAHDGSFFNQFSKVFCPNIKSPKTWKFELFTCWNDITLEFTSVFIGYLNGCKRVHECFYQIFKWV